MLTTEPRHSAAEPAPQPDRQPPPGDAVSIPRPAFRLIYRSHSLILPADRETQQADIFRISRLNNSAWGVTGALLMSDDCICQTLEGEESRVRSLFATIEQDPRHHAVELMDMAMVSAPPFARWAMAQVSDINSDVHLVATRNGTTITARSGTTVEQDRLLAVMRALALDLAAGG